MSRPIAIREKAGAMIIDAPWEYEQWTDAAHGSSKAMGETMTDSEIAALPIGDFAAEDCTVAMWATWPKLEIAIGCLKAWGLDYITGFPWVKTVPSTGNLKRVIGFWTMAASEPLLIARRGKPTLKSDRKRVLGLAHLDERVLWAPGGEKHSEKPMSVHEWLENAVEGPYAELFARRRIRGWNCIGLETGYRITPAGIVPLNEILETKPAEQFETHTIISFPKTAPYHPIINPNGPNPDEFGGSDYP